MKKTAIKNVGDIQSGAIITTEKKHEYVLLRDDAGVPSMYGKDGRFVRLDQNGLCDVKGGHKIAKVSAFLTMPQADQISEALKYLYTGREACAELTVVYEKENEEVKMAKLALSEINDELSEINEELANIFRTLEDNGQDVEDIVRQIGATFISDNMSCDCEDCDCDCDDEDEWDD